MAATSMVASIQTILAYAAVVGLIFIGLSILTIAERRKASVYLGAGDNDRLLRRIRAHANFAEYVPLALILIAGVAIAGAPPGSSMQVAPSSSPAACCMRQRY